MKSPARSADLALWSATRIEVVAGDSPEDAAVPFWVTACVRLQPPRRRSGAEVTASLANAVFPAVQALLADRLRAEGEADVPLNRDRIARRCGLGDGRKAGWLFAYLELIGFLRVRRHYAGVGRGRQADTFTVSTRPPSIYTGPRTHAELERALDTSDGSSDALFDSEETAGHAQGAGSSTYSRVHGTGFGTLVGETAGQPQGAESGTCRADLGAGSGTLVDEAAGEAQGAESGTVLRKDRSSISEREIEGAIEPVPGGTAEPPATGVDEQLVHNVRQLVRRLPWREWAGARLGVPSYELRRHDADRIQDAICTAIDREQVTLQQAVDVACHALAEAKSPVYVVRAFEQKPLSEWLRRLEVEPLSADVLPLPMRPQPGARPVPPAVDKVAASPAAPAASLPACSTCEAREGEGAGARIVPGPDGRHRRCPACRPAAA